MAKECLKDSCSNNRFGGGYCRNHQYLREDKKPSQLKRTPLKKPTKPPRKVGKKTAKLTTQYLKERTAFLDGKICPITGRPATEVHHTNGREYERLIDKEYWLGVSNEGHKWIHANPKEARQKGYLI